MVLTEEQRERIRKNKERALNIQKERKNKSKRNKQKTIKDEFDQKSSERTHTQNLKDLSISCHMESTNNLILDVPQIAILGDIGATNCRFVLYNMRSKL